MSNKVFSGRNGRHFHLKGSYLDRDVKRCARAQCCNGHLEAAVKDCCVDSLHTIRYSFKITEGFTITQKDLLNYLEGRTILETILFKSTIEFLFANCFLEFLWISSIWREFDRQLPWCAISAVQWTESLQVT